jgi:hypothetical protein
MSPLPHARRPLLWSQVFLVGFLVLAVALHPGFVLKGDEGGVSNYGIHLRTAVPYTIAFGLGAFFSLEAARTRAYPTVARGGLVVYAGLLLLTLLSTYVYKLDYGLKLVHVGVGVALISFELLASAWASLWIRTTAATALFVVIIGGFVVAGLTFLGQAHLLFIGESLTTLGFAGVVILTEKRCLSRRAAR